MVTLSAHGGLCCGITHIWGLGTNPASKCASMHKDECEPFYLISQLNAEPLRQDHNLFYGKAPQETASSRVGRYISFLKRERPGSLVQVSLAVGQGASWNNQKRWRPVLKQKGFKLVNSFKNSNTGATIEVYHLELENGKVVR